jgi:6-phosphogluconate dehydrogenase
VFEEWNKGELDSFLIEITANILRYRDEKGEPVVPKILDSAQQVFIYLFKSHYLMLLSFQKGTGKWTGIAALDYGVPVTLIGLHNFS